MQKPFTNFKLNVSPLMFMGVAFILILIITVMAMQTIDARRQSSYEEILNKGVAIMRSVEAGTRTNMYAMPWGNTQLQRLLEESALFPEVIEICITDVNGFILSSSSPQHIGHLLPLPVGVNLPHPSQWEKGTIYREILPGNPFGGAPPKEDVPRVIHIMSRFEPSVKKVPLPQKSDLPQFNRMAEEDSMLFQRPVPKEMPLRLIHVFLSMDSLDTRSRNMALNMVFFSVMVFGAALFCLIIMLIFQNYRSARDSLKKIQLFSDSLVAKMPIGLAALDENGRIANFNQAAEEILQLNTDDVMGKIAKNLLPAPLLEVPPVKGKSFEAEYRLPNNRSIFLEITKSTLLDENHQVSGTLILFKDLTEIKTLQREIMLNQHMASIGRFAAGVAHEIRNPLSSIKGFASYFKNRYKEVESDVKIAEIMISETERLNRVITQLLEFARPIHVCWTDVDMVALIRDSLTLVADAAAKHDIRHEFIADESLADDGHLETDADRVRQVLLNLYLNSIDAMPEGGTLTVTAAKDTDAGQLIVTISDTGKGVAKENIDKIFDPYFTTKASGTGLGLAMVVTTLEALQGRIALESGAGGTNVTIHLPLKPLGGLNMYEDETHD